MGEEFSFYDFFWTFNAVCFLFDCLFVCLIFFGGEKETKKGGQEKVRE